MMRFQIFREFWWLFFLILFALVFRCEALMRASFINTGYIFGNKVNDPRPDVHKRQIYYTSSIAWLEKAGPLKNEAVSLMKYEQAAFIDAYRYTLETKEGIKWIPSRQLFVNPEFALGVFGWIQYQSQWILVKNNYWEQDENIVMFEHSGQRHATLSQEKTLASNSCYLLVAQGTVERMDDTPTFWLYWETYDAENKPIGRSLIKSTGDQAWQKRYGIFCLPESDEEFQKVIIAPVNVYGDALVYLANARLYELEEANQ